MYIKSFCKIQPQQFYHIVSHVSCRIVDHIEGPGSVGITIKGMHFKKIKLTNIIIIGDIVTCMYYINLNNIYMCYIFDTFSVLQDLGAVTP